MRDLILKLMPASWRAAAEVESRQWMIACECGVRRSVWDAGGLRWKARGNGRVRVKCHVCGVTSWKRLVKMDG